jgi:hypothetical protein
MELDSEGWMGSKGMVLSTPDKKLQALAAQHKLAVTVDAELPLAYDKTLFTQPGTGVPWDLLPAAWHFLERWDAAVPLWRYGVNATDVGTKSERTRTQKVIRDLRVLLHSVQLLFVRDNEDGRALMDAYREELSPRGEDRLAFLRALYRVKPRCCVLPVTWLAEVAQGYVPPRLPRHAQLVQVEIGPGRFVRCKPENVEKVRRQFERMRRRH